MYNYTIKKTDNYEVLLKPNEFYTTEKLPSGLYYPGRAVDDYLVNFEYNFKANEKKTLEYNYNIIAEMSGTVETNYGKDKEVWTRTFTILENKSENTDENSFVVNEQAVIDYDYYNNLARSYEETYGIDINSVLKVKFNMNVPELKLEDCIELDIDITNNVTNLQENYEKTTTNIVPEVTQETDKSQVAILIISSLMVLFAIIYGVMWLKREKTSDGKYKNKVKHVLKYYDDIIAVVEDEPNLEGLKAMKISNLDDLVKIAEQSRRNIIFYETIKNKKSNLYVIVDGYCYIYSIT